MPFKADVPDEKPENANKSPRDYDEYGHEPPQDDDPPKPDEALTDPA